MRRATARLGSLSLEILPFLWSTQLPTAVKTLVVSLPLENGPLGEGRSRSNAGQIIATSHDLTSKGSKSEGKCPAISGKSRLVKYYNLTRIK